MNRIKTRNRRKLLLEYLPLENTQDSLNRLLSENKVGRLKYNNINTVIIQSLEPVEPSLYLRLINEFTRLGFEVKTNHLDSLGDDELDSIRFQVQDIHESLKKGSCLVVSYGRSYALPLICSFFIFSGYSIDNAIDLSNRLNPNLSLNELEESFLYSFHEYITDNKINGYGIRIKDDAINRPFNKEDRPEKTVERAREDVSEEKTAADPVMEERDFLIDESNLTPINISEGFEESEPRTEIESEEIETVSEVKNEDIVSEKIPGIKAEPEKTEKTEEHPARRYEDNKIDREEDLADLDRLTSVEAGPFYKSIRFKLVSIISVIIIFSLTGMIFLASYFFKQDNTIRVQENNHKISELVALKASSDINTLVDKSKFLIAAREKGNRENRLGNAAKSLNEDREILFIGITEKRVKSGRVNFSNILFNRTLISEMQVIENDITNAITVSSGDLMNAFDGDRLIQNMSQDFEGPVIGLSVPYSQNANRKVLSVLVIVVKFDDLAKTFKTSGIINPVMVNDRGDIIGHPDSTLIKSGDNWREYPLVKIMMESKLDNGMTRFKDNNGVLHLGSFKKIGFGGAGVIAYTKEQLALQEVYNIQRRNLFLMIAVLSGAVIIVFFFGKSLTQPIIKLLKATNYIKEGQYRVNIKPSSNDEIGQLTASFIEMGRGLEEREKMKDAFGKFVNKEIADRVLSGEIRLGGEKKTAAVFFSDIRSFTSISEKLDPEEVVEFLNDYMTRMVKCVNETEGVVDKYIGDAIMAEWGVPISKGNDTERAIDAALMMRNELIDFNKGRGGDKKPIIKIGCGINTGPVLAGQIGSEDRMEYTVIGDAVNLASRIEALNKPFGTDILISQDSYKLVEGIYYVEKMAPISVKGKSEKQQIYAVLGRKDDPEALKTLDAMRSLLGLQKMDFKRRSTDNDDEFEEEAKYEIFDS
jgi:adenylate cyclase